MIEIFLFIYCSSLLLSGLLLIWNIQSVRRQLHSSELKTLNSNLKKINLFWSLSNDSLQLLETQSYENDHQMAYRSCFLTGLLGFASFPGFFLYLVLTLSLALVESKLKMGLLSSVLCKAENLPVDQVETILKKIKEEI